VHHHHHHHHGGGMPGGEGTGAEGVATTASSSEPASGTTSPTSTLASDRTVSQAFAADILKAIEAYGGNTATSTMPALTA
jgi:hypothetical protein